MAIDGTRPIGVIVAMEAELRHFLAAATVERETSDGIWLDRHLTVGGNPVVAVCCRIGLINAAAATERLIGAHRPRAILNYGCSGAHRRDILPGDVVIGERVVHHSATQILAGGEERYRGFGIDVGGESIDAAELAADPALLALARTVAAGYAPTPWPAESNPSGSVPDRGPVVLVGSVASSDIWTQSQARLDLLHQRHGSLCEEMEAAAIAQVAALHEVPFLCIKDISNNEYHQPSDIETFSDFPMAEIGRRAAGLTVRLIERMGHAT